MGILRNFIDITGITPEEELPNKVNGEIIQYSEIDYIFVPGDKQGVNSIYQIFINVDIKSNRTINAPLGEIIVLDGIKKIKLIYTQKGKTDKANILILELPYNTFIEVPKGAGMVKNIDINIVDAYFTLIDSRKIYSHILYMLNVNYDNNPKEEAPCNNIVNIISNKDEQIFNSKEIPRVQNEAHNEMVLSSITSSGNADSKLKKNFEKDDLLMDINEEYL